VEDLSLSFCFIFIIFFFFIFFIFFFFCLRLLLLYAAPCGHRKKRRPVAPWANMAALLHAWAWPGRGVNPMMSWPLRGNEQEEEAAAARKAHGFILWYPTQALQLLFIYK